VDQVVRKSGGAPRSSVLLEIGTVSSVGLEKEENRSMPTGTIKKLVSDRGFGFIAAEDGKEYFFHRTGLDNQLNFDSLAGGERVTFEIEASAKGPRAGRVKPA
jgi:CspA family cold shock protein